MRRASIAKIGWCVACAFTFASAGCITIGGDNLRGKAARTDELTAQAGDVAALDISTNVGTIRLDAAQTAEVRITADITVKARTDEEAQELLEGVRIEAEPSGDTLVVKAVKPSGFGRNQLNVDFTIQAPARLRLDGSTNVGDIRTEGFTSRINAKTNVGNIACTGLRDAIDLHTDVGDIRAVYAPDAPAALDVDAATNVGNITFEGPTEISASLTAASNVGDIHTDRPIQVTGSLNKSVKASLGDAAGRINLRTNVGSIIIR
jgi:hypothetical protein